ncbi:MAG: N-methyl-L-tryptophan oxidase [Longimicrobiales bacterium]
MKPDYDVVVAGLGVMGSAILLELARRGHRVLGVDARRPPHTAGSSHGRTRIIREAYFENPLYVPLVRRAYDGWRRLESATGRSLMRVTGGLNIGPQDGMLVQGTLASVRTHQIAHESMTADEIRRRFPGLAPQPSDVGVFEANAGMLFAEECVRAQLDGAAGEGATLRLEEELLDWRADGDGAWMITAHGTHHAGAIVLALGAWLAPLLAPAGVPLTVERQTHHWFAAGGELRAERCPVMLWEYEPLGVFWAVPDIGHGLKAGIHHDGAITASPDEIDRTVRADDEQRVRALLDTRIPATGRSLGAEVCLYTNTPDRGFIIDRHPSHENVVIASACSGHGFKFAPVLAEVAADLVTGRTTDSGAFGLARFGPAR